MKFYIIPLDYQNLHQRPHSKDLSAFWPPGQLAKGHQAGQLWYCCWFASGAGAAASPGHPVMMEGRGPLLLPHMIMVSDRLMEMPCA